MASELHPLVFRPVTTPGPSPGKLMARYLARAYGELAEPLGEAWLLFDDGKRSSIVANGPLEQTPLADLVKSRSDELVGRAHSPKKPFPLAIRLLDTGADQPLQVHPDSETLVDHAAGTNAKFWHSLDHEPGARVIVGIAQQVTNQQILLSLDKPGFEQLLQRYPARNGDSFLVPPGFVHSVGAGNLVLEVQQRYTQPLVLQTGTMNKSEKILAEQLALEAINREARTNLRISREAGAASHTRRILLTPNCPEFQIEEIRLQDHIFLRTDDQCFNLIVVTRGKVVVRWKDLAIRLIQGMLCCIPAACGDYKIELVDTPAEMLRVRTQ